MSDNARSRHDIMIVAPLVGVVMQAGALIWHLGKLDARMDAKEKTVVELKREVQALSDKVSTLRESVAAESDCRLKYQRGER